MRSNIRSNIRDNDGIVWKVLFFLVVIPVVVSFCVYSSIMIFEKNNTNKISTTSSLKAKEKPIYSNYSDDYIYKTVQLLKREEGFSHSPIEDVKGKITFGYGLTIGQITSDKTFEDFNNLYITKERAEELLELAVIDIDEKLSHGKHKWTYKELNNARKKVLISMVYQMGVKGTYDFKKMWSSLENKDYSTAEKEMKNSKWCRQTKGRCERQAKMMGE